MRAVNGETNPGQSPFFPWFPLNLSLRLPISPALRPKRQRAGALQDASRISGVFVNAPAFWTAVVLHRFSPERGCGETQPQHIQTHHRLKIFQDLTTFRARTATRRSSSGRSIARIGQRRRVVKSYCRKQPNQSQLWLSRRVATSRSPIRHSHRTD